MGQMILLISPVDFMFISFLHSEGVDIQKTMDLVMMTGKATVSVMKLTIKLNAIMTTEIVVKRYGLVMEIVMLETTS